MISWREINPAGKSPCRFASARIRSRIKAEIVIPSRLHRTRMIPRSSSEALKFSQPFRAISFSFAPFNEKGAQRVHLCTNVVLPVSPLTYSTWEDFGVAIRFKHPRAGRRAPHTPLEIIYFFSCDSGCYLRKPFSFLCFQPRKKPSSLPPMPHTLGVRTHTRCLGQMGDRSPCRLHHTRHDIYSQSSSIPGMSARQ